MKNILRRRILATVDAADFVGRAPHRDRLAQLSRSSGGLLMLAAPATGASEILRRTFDDLFTGQEAVVPVYFQFRTSDSSAEDAARRFLYEFLTQAVAFRRRDPRPMGAAPSFDELARLAIPSDGYWVDALIDDLGASPARKSTLLSGPLRTVPHGIRPFLLFDDVHTALALEGGEGLVAEICETYGRSTTPFVLAGLRRELYAKAPLETLAVEPFSFAEAGKFVENAARMAGVEINDQTRDLIAVQLGGCPGNISGLLLSASDDALALTSFENVQKIYTDEIFGGRISLRYDAMLDEVAADHASRERLLWLLTETAGASGGRAPVSYWKRHSKGIGADLEAILRKLHVNEIVNFTDGNVDIDVNDIVLADYLNARRRLEIEREPRSIVVGDAVARNIKRAPSILARFYRRNSAIDLHGLMSAFDGRRVSPAFLDYGRFKDEFRGADDEKILRSLKEDNAAVELPKVVYTAETASFYPKLSEISDPSRSVAAVGFAGKEQMTWIAAQIDSKLEATRDLTAFWCDRLEMAAVGSDIENFRLWLISPAGFSEDAVALLRERDAFGSSLKQVELLAEVIGAVHSKTPGQEEDEYEIVVPMGENTEMIAAHTVEEIAKRHNFPAKSINQIKTALVEACINATEHSMSPDRRIHQRFAVTPDRITITVTNRGVRLGDRPSAEPAENERRGWGLKLIKGLMDEVRIEDTDDGTRLTMVKYLEKARSAAGDTQ